MSPVSGKSTTVAEAVVERLEHDGALGGPPAVDRLLADAGALGDRLDRDLVVAELADQGDGGGEDGATRALVAPGGIGR